MLQWYALGVKPNRERKVMQALDDMLIYAYAPRCVVKSVVNGKVTKRKVLLFPGYVFVKVDVDKPGWQRARYVKGATGLLPKASAKPEAIPTRFIEDVRSEIKTDDLTADECWERVKNYAPGDAVRVIDGLLLDQEGKFESYQAGMVGLLFSLLGKQNRIYVPAQHVARAPDQAPRRAAATF